MDDVDTYSNGRELTREDVVGMLSEHTGDWFDQSPLVEMICNPEGVESETYEPDAKTQQTLTRFKTFAAREYVDTDQTMTPFTYHLPRSESDSPATEQAELPIDGEEYQKPESVDVPVTDTIELRTTRDVYPYVEVNEVAMCERLQTLIADVLMSEGQLGLTAASIMIEAEEYGLPDRIFTDTPAHVLEPESKVTLTAEWFQYPRSKEMLDSGDNQFGDSDRSGGELTMHDLEQYAWRYLGARSEPLEKAGETLLTPSGANRRIVEPAGKGWETMETYYKRAFDEGGERLREGLWYALYRSEDLPGIILKPPQIHPSENTDEDPLNLIHELDMLETPQPVGDGCYALAHDEQRYGMLPNDEDDETTATRKKMEFLGHPEEAIKGALSGRRSRNWHEELGMNEWIYSVFTPYDLGYTLEGAQRMVADGRYYSHRIATSIEKMQRPELYKMQDILCNTLADQLDSGQR